MEIPYRDRIRMLTRHWVDYGAGNPKFVMFIYIAKMIVLAIAGWGADVSKLNRHFELVIPPMVSNTPWNPSKSIKRRHYANFPDDCAPRGRRSC